MDAAARRCTRGGYAHRADCCCNTLMMACYPQALFKPMDEDVWFAQTQHFDHAGVANHKALIVK